MLGVFKSTQSLAHGVVAPARSLTAALAAALALGALPLDALAAPVSANQSAPEHRAPSRNESAPRESAPREPAVEPAPLETPPPRREDSYRGLLTASYVIAPFAALAIGGALAGLETSDSVAVVSASSAFLAPAAVHAAHGNTRGPLSLLGMVGSTAGGVLLGGVAGHFIGGAGCDPDEDSDGCDFASLDGIILGSLLGGITGYTGFAIFDVIVNGAVTVEDPLEDQASLQLWLNPLPAARSERADSTTPFSGLHIGATLQM